MPLTSTSLEDDSIPSTSAVSLHHPNVILLMEVDNQNNHRSSGGENDHGFVTTADDINRDVSDV